MGLRTLWWADKLAGRKLEQATQRYLHRLAQAPAEETRRSTTRLLADLRGTPGPKVYVGRTPWGENVDVPLLELVKAVGLTTGGMGSGKTFFALVILEALIRRMPQLRNLSFGVIDPKGELFERALWLLNWRLNQLRGPEQDELLRKIVVIDFANREALSSYNILARWPYTEQDYFVTSRLETLRDLLPSSEKLSLRGSNVLKYALELLSEFNLPLTYLDRVLSADDVRGRLLAASRRPDVRYYFQRHFGMEGKQTKEALRARMDSLFASEGVRLALSGSAAPDFRQLQNEGKIVLINCAGPTISRGVRLLLQGLVLADIRQSIFARPNNPEVTYLWCADEAQNFFLTQQQKDNFPDLLNMARSYGSFFYLLCQNLSTAIPDARILEMLFTNIRWSLTLRGSPRDAAYLKSALPVTGRRRRPEPHPFREAGVYRPEEERTLALNGIASLPDREGYLWLRTRSAEAVAIRTPNIALPEGDAFRAVVDTLRNDPAFGARSSRSEYQALVRDRDRRWAGSGASEDVRAKLEDAYRQAQELPV